MYSKGLTHAVRCLLLLAVVFFASSCGVDKQFFSTLPLPAQGWDPGATAVCDPFGDPGNDGGQGNGGTVSANNGLIANVFYLPANLPRYNSVFDYETNGTLLQNNL